MKKQKSKRTSKHKAKLSKAEAVPSPVEDRSYEARYDLDTLTKAEEIRANKSRHAAAKAEGVKQANRLRGVIGGPRSHSDEADMDRYAQHRQHTTRGK